MVRPLCEAKPGTKQLWVTRGTQHAHSLPDYPDDYLHRLKTFLGHRR